MTEQEYNQAEGIRRSDLWRMNDSPEKFKWFLDHPGEKSPAMLFGSACHKMILEPADFGKEYAVAPEINRRTNAGKAEWDAFCADNAGNEIISKEDAETMAGMEAALENCEMAYDLIRGEGQTEVPLFWTDRETGEKCKVKCDRIVERDGRTYIVDYKTTTCAETEKFNQEIFRYGYHFQAAMYTEGLRHVYATNDVDRPGGIGFIFVAQEKKAPYAVNVIEVSEEVMMAGRVLFRDLLDRYHECKTADVWPGYVMDGMNETFLPGWMSIGEEDE